MTVNCGHSVCKGHNQCINQNSSSHSYIILPEKGEIRIFFYFLKNHLKFLQTESNSENKVSCADRSISGVFLVGEVSDLTKVVHYRRPVAFVGDSGAIQLCIFCNMNPWMWTFDLFLRALIWKSGFFVGLWADLQSVCGHIF